MDLITNNISVIIKLQKYSNVFEFVNNIEYLTWFS